MYGEEDHKAMPCRILYVHGVTAFGGAERDLISIIGELDRERFTPIVVCPDRGPLFQRLTQQSVRVLILPLPPWRKVRFLFSWIPSVYRLYRLLIQENIQLVHVNDMWWIPHGYWASRLATIPCLAHIRQELEPRRIHQYQLQSPQVLIAVSNRVQDQLVQGGVASEHIRTFYSGIALSHQDLDDPCRVIRERYDLQAEQLVIGTVAHVFPRKGYEYLIVALASVRQTLPHVRCLIVGEGDPEYTARLQALVQQHGLESVLFFVGYQADVRPYLKVMDIMVLPSILEGFGIALLEAMAMGTPVVATRVGGIPEVVDEGVTGLLVKPKDAESLAVAILSLLCDPERRRHMGQAGIQRVEAMFTSERLGGQLMALYDELCPIG